MARLTTPIHSSNPSDPDVYRECSNCNYYQAIPDRNRQRGTNGYRRCSRCTSLMVSASC